MSQGIIVITNAKVAKVENGVITASTTFTDRDGKSHSDWYEIGADVEHLKQLGLQKGDQVDVVGETTGVKAYTTKGGTLAGVRSVQAVFGSFGLRQSGESSSLALAAGRVTRQKYFAANGDLRPKLQLTVPTDAGRGEQKSTVWNGIAISGNRATALSDQLGDKALVVAAGPAGVRAYEGSKGPGAEPTIQAFLFDFLSSRSSGAASHEYDEPCNEYAAEENLDEVPFA